MELLEEEASACELVPQATATAIGVNAYYLQEQATRALRNGEPESAILEETFRKVRALGLSWVRTWAFNDGEEKKGISAIQLEPLVYDELSFRGLDWVLSRAAAHQVKLVLPLGNYWDHYGGARRYAGWAQLAEPHTGDERFFTDPKVIAHYREHVRRLLNRVNTFDGIRYGDHPAVWAWELLNEPRTTGMNDGATVMREWVDSISSEIRANAPNHLISTGEEGFDSSSSFTGDGAFSSTLQAASIDLASVHFFPEAWQIAREEIATAGARWISAHATLARAAGKQLLVGEVGLRNQGVFSLEERRALLRGWLRCAKNSGAAGMAPWMFAYDSFPEEWDEYTFRFRDGSTPEDPGNQYADLLRDAAAE